MARRLSFAIAQPITIVGWFIASFLLIALVIAAPARLTLPSPPDHAFTQAYYYAIMAAVLYFLVALLMVITVYGAYQGRYSREFKLSVSQRTLMLQTISFLIYLLLGALVFSHIEGWQFLDGVYWADVTLFTVGFGDYTLATHLGRALLFPFSIMGTVMLGLVIGSVRSLVLERGKEKMEVRMIEETRKRAMKNLKDEKKTISLGRFSKHDFETDGISDKARLEREFRIMRKVQEHAAQRRRWNSLAISAGAWVGLWLVGAAVFYQTEHSQGWTYFQSIFFSYVALLTIGYGDFHPRGNSGKAFFVFWSLLAVPTMTILISNMGETLIKLIRDLSLWVGDLALLPGDKGIRDALKESAPKYTRGSSSAKNIETEDPVGLSGERRVHNEGKRARPSSKPIEGMIKEFESAEQNESEDAAKKGDQFAANIHHHQYLLMKEIREVMTHLNDSPPRKYSYEEWTWFLKLIGQEVRPSIGHNREPEGESSKQSDPHGSISRRGPWSWLSLKSPLMSTKTEAEWALEKLALSLEKLLKKHREQKEEGEKKGKSS